MIDELRFVPFDRASGELLFNLLADRYERKSAIVTTNLAFGQWVKVFGRRRKADDSAPRSPRAHATMMATKAKSYRMRKEGNQGGES